MIILIKTPTNTFSLEADTADKIEKLILKVGERASLEPYQFSLLFAGEPLDSTSTVGSNGIKKESTIHLHIIKQLKYTINYNDNPYIITVPNNKGLTVYNLTQQTINHINGLADESLKITRMISSSLKQGNSVLPPSGMLQTTADASLHLELEVVQGDATPPYLPSIAVEPQQVEAMMEVDKDDLISSFVENSISNDVEIAFCFDTTGSMSSVLQNVRTKVTETVTRLMKEIPNIKIAVMGLGDYCDGRKLLTTCDLTSNVDKLVKFIKECPTTGGGDEPEAYEYALYKAKYLSWSKHTSKAFVMIGDAQPHGPSYTKRLLDWVVECDNLGNMGVKIYGIVCVHENHRLFYQTISERTGGLCLLFSRFNLITEMFLAICFRETSAKKLEEFRKEAESNDKEMQEMFDQLEKPNFQVASNMYSDAGSSTSTTTTTTTTTTLKLTSGDEEGEEEKKDEVVVKKEEKLIIKKRYGVLTNYRDPYEDPVYKRRYERAVIAMSIGSLHIGFSTVAKVHAESHIFSSAKIYLHDFRMDEMETIQCRSIFLATYSFDSIDSFNQLDQKIIDLKKIYPTSEIVLLGLKSDLKNTDPVSTTSTTTDEESTSTRSRSRSLSFITFKKEKDEKKKEGSITKEMRSMLCRNRGLVGDLECNRNPSSVASMESSLYKICQSKGITKTTYSTNYHKLEHVASSQL